MTPLQTIVNGSLDQKDLQAPKGFGLCAWTGEIRPFWNFSPNIKEILILKKRSENACQPHNFCLILICQIYQVVSDFWRFDTFFTYFYKTAIIIMDEQFSLDAHFKIWSFLKIRLMSSDKISILSHNGHKSTSQTEILCYFVAILSLQSFNFDSKLFM